VPALTGLDCNGARPGPALYLPEYSDDNSRKRQALVLSKRLVDAFFYRFVLRPQRHFVVLRVLFHLRTAGCRRLLHRCFVGLVRCFRECWSQKEAARDDGRECSRHECACPYLRFPSAPVTVFATLCDGHATWRISRTNVIAHVEYLSCALAMVAPSEGTQDVVA